ncbi:MAG: peptide ABC transporter substrate-binding protein [Roseburia sp.]|nr:peptide ABC transporter substrate-binding protein [Roseburia sp.]
MHNMKKVWAVLLAGVLAAGTLAGCGGGDGETQVATPGSDGSVSVSTEAGGAGEDGGSAGGADTQVMNVGTKSFGNNYDVQDMGWRWMMADCYEGLYRNANKGDGEEFLLAGAESVDVSEDGTVYTFHLRQNAKWSDGEPVTAHDYEYGWKRLANPEFAYDYASFVYNVVGAEEYNKGTGSADDMMAVALDDYTFQVTLKVADPTFEVKLVATPLYPTRQDIAEAAGDQWGKDWTLCVYNGPFCMTELVEDNKMTWTKNPYYWDADNTHLDAVNWYIVPEDSTMATMFDNGELDQLQTAGDYLAKYRGEADAGNIQLRVTDYPGTIGLRFNGFGNDPSGLMSNVKIRKAIAYSFNKEEMVEAVYGRYKPAYSYVAPGINFDGSSYRSQVDEVVKAEYEEYVDNPEKLQALFQEGLNELGIDTPISEITLTYLSSGSTNEANAEREYLQQTIQQNLGCKVELNTVGDSALFRAERDAGNFDFFNSGWYADYNDPLDFLYTFYTDAYGTSFGGYSNPKYDELVDALTGETDLAKRKEIYQQLEETLLLEDCAFAPIYYSTKEVFLQNWVKDYCTSNFGASAEFYTTYIEGRNS